MITVRLLGGLGNQLFQVAAGCYLAGVHGRRVRFDTSWFSVQAHRTDTHRSLEVASLLGSREQVRLPSRLAGVVYHRRNPWLSREISSGPDLLGELPGHVRWLDGYFQRAHYPLAVKDRLAERLSPVLDATRPVASAAGALGVHLRLGDYYANPTTRAHHGVASVSYYADAVSELLADGGYPRVAVFTDSPEVARREFLPALSVEAELVHDRDAWETLADLACCAGLVMSNSSLSWWAGFIGTVLQERSMAVIQPTPWFAAPSPSDQLLSIPAWRTRQRALIPPALPIAASALDGQKVNR